MHQCWMPTAVKQEEEKEEKKNRFYCLSVRCQLNVDLGMISAAPTLDYMVAIIQI